MNLNFIYSKPETTVYEIEENSPLMTSVLLPDATWIDEVEL